jgi:hypothetical protein
MSAHVAGREAGEGDTRMTQLTTVKRRRQKYEDRPEADAELAHQYVQKPRSCLGCHEKFSSQWIGNRLCHACADLAASRG